MDGIVISIGENAKQNIHCSSGMYEPSRANILFFISIEDYASVLKVVYDYKIFNTKSCLTH